MKKKPRAENIAAAKAAKEARDQIAEDLFGPPSVAEAVKTQALQSLVDKRAALQSSLEAVIARKDVNGFIWLLAEIVGHFAIHGTKSPLSSTLESEVIKGIREMGVTSGDNQIGSIIQSPEFQKIFEARKRALGIDEVIDETTNRLA
jgi:hypothetical protein